jgi:predicted amidohydrolase
VWPTVHDLHQLASRHYAFEGRCFVVAVGLMMPVEDLPVELVSGITLQPDSSRWVENGGSAIIGPDSQYVLDPVFDREELLVADLDVTEIDRETMTLDVTGHYARPDLFRFEKKV